MGLFAKFRRPTEPPIILLMERGAAIIRGKHVEITPTEEQVRAACRQIFAPIAAEVGSAYPNSERTK